MGSPGAPNNIGYNARFLVSGFSSTNRHALHDVTDLGTIGVSRGGAIVHELTRPYLDTADLVIPLGVLTPLSKGSQAGVKTYGPYACCAVGKFAPDLSITNADTYRFSVRMRGQAGTEEW